MRPSRRWLALPLLLGLGAVIVGVASVFRLIGLGEAAGILAVLALVFVVEGGRYIVKRFLAGYRRKG